MTQRNRSSAGKSSPRRARFFGLAAMCGLVAGTLCGLGSTTALAQAAGGAGSQDAAAPAQDGRQRIYFVNLTGEFGEQISPKPFADVLEDARENKADIIIFNLDNEWVYRDDRTQERVDVAQEGRFNEWRDAELFIKLLTERVRAEWEKPPRIVFWIRRAMGGLAFLPFIGKENYFHSDGKMGGIGNLTLMYQDRGDEVVQQKMISLQLQTAVSWANMGGYPEELVRAMTMPAFVLTVKIVDGKPRYFERMPQGPDEELLTDNGEGVNADSLSDIARGGGNDVLTLTPRVAKLINFSQGTVDTREELLAALGLDREGVIVAEGSGDRIMARWARDLKTAEGSLRRMMLELGEIPNGGANVQAQRQNISRRINKWTQIQTLLRRFSEGWDPRFLMEQQVPINGDGTPNLVAIQNQIEDLRNQLLALR